MKSLRIPICLVVAIIASAVAWRTVQTRARQQTAQIGSQQQLPSQPATSIVTTAASL
jgi:cell division protein FtsL